MPRKKRKDVFKEIYEIFEEKLRSASLHDLAFFSAWIASSYLMYQGLKGLTKLPDAFFKPGLPALQDIEWIRDLITEDPASIAIAVVAGYKVVTTDIDFASALALIRAGLS